MIKSFKCADVWKVCSWRKANTIHELMQQIAEHAKHAHDIDELSEKLTAIRIESQWI